MKYEYLSLLNAHKHREFRENPDTKEGGKDGGRDGHIIYCYWAQIFFENPLPRKSPK
jgi:hypothetical protein